MTLLHSFADSRFGNKSAFLFIVCTCLFTGCKGGKNTDQAGKAEFSLTPEQTVEKIMAAYDSNGDGMLDAGELERCPSLKTLLGSMNKSRLTAEEITDRLRSNQSVTVHAKSVRCLVTLDGQELADAVVTLTPEPFHGSGIATATGTTGPDGKADLKAPKGVSNAFYRVSISKQVGGQETLPSIYNSATTLGAEVGAFNASRAGRLEFHLRNR
jgi:hypothetical protein